jgi:hypothetical protein
VGAGAGVVVEGAGVGDGAGTVEGTGTVEGAGAAVVVGAEEAAGAGAVETDGFGASPDGAGGTVGSGAGAGAVDVVGFGVIGLGSGLRLGRRTLAATTAVGILPHVDRFCGTDAPLRWLIVRPAARAVPPVVNISSAASGATIRRR